MLESVFLSSDDKLITQPSCRHHTFSCYWGRGACILPKLISFWGQIALLHFLASALGGAVWPFSPLLGTPSEEWSDIDRIHFFTHHALFALSTDSWCSFWVSSLRHLSDAKQIKSSEWCRAICDVADLFEVGRSVGARQQWQQLTGTKFLICVWNP